MGIPVPPAASRSGGAFWTPGKRPEIDEIYETYWSWIVRAMSYLGVPAAECEDAAQEVIIDLQRGLPTYDPYRPFEPWLRAVVRNGARDFMRGVRRRPPSAGPPEGDLEPADPRPDPAMQMEHREMERELPGLIRKVPRLYRTIFRMRFVDQLSVAEVAGELGIKERTVRSRSYRGRVAFDAALAKRRRRGDLAIVPLLAPKDAWARIARLWKRLLRLLGMGFGGAVVPVSAPTLAGGAVLLLAVGAGGGAALHATLARPPPAEASPIAAASADLAVPSASPLPSPSPSPDPLPTATARTSHTAAPDPVAAMRAEQEIIGRARRAFGEGKLDAALRELDRHERLYRDGALASDRRALAQEVAAALAMKDGGLP